MKLGQIKIFIFFYLQEVNKKEISIRISSDLLSKLCNQIWIVNNNNNIILSKIIEEFKKKNGLLLIKNKKNPNLQFQNINDAYILRKNK